MISATDQRQEKAASQIHLPTFAPHKPPLPQGLPPPPLLPSCGGEMEQIGRQNLLHEA
ncbi:MAG: hypothetical protein ACP5PV_05035 [Methanothrix sp.]